MMGDGIRVVLVDDDRDTLMTLGILLRSEGFDVHLVQKAEDVMEAVAQKRPHGVLMDIVMPRRSGLRVADDLRRAYGARCPVLLAVSARDDPLTRQGAEAAGFSRFIAKPYDPDQVLQLLSLLHPQARVAS